MIKTPQKYINLYLTRLFVQLRVKYRLFPYGASKLAQVDLELHNFTYLYDE